MQQPDTPVLPRLDDGATPMDFGPRFVVIASLVLTLAIAAAGSLSEIALGDEVVHARQAKSFTRSWERLAFDPLWARPGIQDPLPYVGTPLWHVGLGALWRLVGHSSHIVAQVYQAGFYLLLLLSVYFATLQIWGRSAGAWAWLIAAAMPMYLTYSILLYQDVPGVAVSALAICLLCRRQFWWSGVAWAAAYLLKMNMLSFVPLAAVFAIWWADGSWKRRIIGALAIGLPVAAALGYDVMWRTEHYNGWMQEVFPGDALQRLSNEARLAILTKPEHFVRFKPFAFYNPVSIVSHLGVPALAGIVAALWKCRDRGSLWLWAGVALCVAGFVIMFLLPGSANLRYLIPAVLLLTILGAVGLARIRLPQWLAWILVAGACLQVGVTLGYVYHQRHVPPADEAAYVYLRENAAPSTRIMFPERILMDRANRRVIWYALNPARFTTVATNETRKELLDFFNVSHLVVPLDRVYDPETEGRHDGGYPRPFIEEARTIPWLEEVFANEAMIIFRYTDLNCTPKPDA